MKCVAMFPGKPTFFRFFQKAGRQEVSGRDFMSRLLGASAALYEAGARARRGLYRRGWRESQHLPAPVISVGNLAVGGTGKTPVTAFLARLFQEQGRRVAILSRGYGGRRRGVTLLSDGERLFYRPPEVGEEAFWLARSLPGVMVYTGPCRFEAGLAAWRDLRPDIFLLDDGFQHFQLARDLDIVLLDAERPFGNGRLLPAGPLREPLTTLREADVLILSRYDDRRHRDRLDFLRRSFPDQEIFTAVIEPFSARRVPGGEEHPLEALRGLRALAFAGIARPEVFQETLRSLGVDLRGFREFPDHYAFAPADLSDLVHEARHREAQALITTSKDWARLGETWPGDLPLWVLEIEVRMESEDALRKCLAAALGEMVGSASPQRAHAELEAPCPTPPQVRRRFRRLTRTGRSLAGPSTVRRILVRAPNWVGDAVMSLPVLTGLTRLFPAAPLTVLAVPRVAPLFAGQPGVAEVISYPAGKEKWRLMLGLRGRFDLALALPNSFESALGLWLSRIPLRLGYAANGRSPLLTTVLKGKACLQGVHQVFYYLGLLEAWGPVRDFFSPRIHLSQEELAEGRERLSMGGSNSGGPWIGLAPGASYGPAKRWPAERFAAVGDILHQEFQARLVLLGGPDDREAAASVQRLGGGRFLNLAGQTTLRQALAVTSHLQALITNDSGLMHAAAALGTPVVALFGSTNPAATGPFSRRATIIHHHLPCSPCLKRTCSRDYACLMDITVAEVAAAARAWLEER
jgi:lipopolysaccharide heptosyltransferase II/tetraacyldisaccharide 4'-kinase